MRVALHRKASMSYEGLWVTVRVSVRTSRVARETGERERKWENGREAEERIEDHFNRGAPIYIYRRPLYMSRRI